MSLRYALLGLLNDGQASGYELTQRFSSGIDRYAWSATHSQIYPELRKLEAEALVEVVEEGARGSRSYGITSAGKTELREWLLSPPTNKGARNEFVLRLFLITALSGEESIDMLTEISEQAKSEMTGLAATVDRLTSKARSTRNTGIYAAKLGVYMYRAIHEWTEWAIRDFDENA